jgi:hypothetical protein
MNIMKIGSHSVWMLLVFLAVGAIVGGLLGELMRQTEAFAGLVPYVASETPVFAVAPFELNLFVFRFTMGISFSPNLMAGLGMIAAIFAFRKY